MGSTDALNFIFFHLTFPAPGSSNIGQNIGNLPVFQSRTQTRHHFRMTITTAANLDWPLYAV